MIYKEDMKFQDICLYETGKVVMSACRNKLRKIFLLFNIYCYVYNGIV